MIHDKDAPRKQQEIESPQQSVEQNQEQAR